MCWTLVWRKSAPKRGEIENIFELQYNYNRIYLSNIFTFKIQTHRTRMDIVFLIIGLAVGFLFAFFFLKSKSEGALSTANEKARLLEQSANDLKNDLRNAGTEAERKLSEERRKTE